MPLHLPNVQNSFKRDTKTPGETQLELVSLVVGARLSFASGTWTINELTQDGSTTTKGNGATYEPPFQVRGMSIMDTDSTGQVVQFDLCGSGYLNENNYSYRAQERLIFGTIYRFHVTRIYLSDVVTTATIINLWG